jgi:hypothetical protein
MKRLIRNTILWLTLLAVTYGFCLAPGWFQTTTAFVFGLVSIPMIAYIGFVNPSE